MGWLAALWKTKREYIFDTVHITVNYILKILKKELAACVHYMLKSRLEGYII